jgi:hypothetical protein
VAAGELPLARPERPQGVERNIVLIRSSKANPLAPSPLWGPNPIWDSQTSINNQMMDEKGRVWAAARIHPPNNPAFCKKGSDHPSAKIFPLNAWSQQLSMYDPASGKFTLIST